MQIVVDNHKFDYDMGCRMLKLKHGENCPFPEIAEGWADLKPLTFAEIAKLPNLEERRVGINCLGIERLVAEINPKLVDKQTIKKTTTWVDTDGLHVSRQFADTYELFEVDGDIFNEGLESWRKMRNAYYIRCKDTSTDREYLIWVDVESVYRANNDSGWYRDINSINAIQCIAWTIQTDVPKDSIEKILRQGDCILIKPKGVYVPLTTPRHLSEQEYRELLVAES